VSGPDNVRLFLVSVYRSKPNTHQAPGGYWFMRVTPTGSSTYLDLSITPKRAQELKALGALQLPDGGAFV